jgi:tRNA (cmo5U34)-methyltransferase
MNNNKDNGMQSVELLEEMSRFFNNRTKVYEEKHLEGIDGGMESKNIIASFFPDYTKTIIDLGIGTGLELEGIFKRFPDVEVIGLDIADNMLQLLKEKYLQKNIKLYCKSYFDYNFGISRFDVALSVMTLHHYDHNTKTELYKKIFHCLKHNGIYIEFDYMLSEKEYDNPQEKEDFYFSEYKRLKLEQGLTDNKEYHFDTPCTVNNQKKMLLKAGFLNVEEVWNKELTITEDYLNNNIVKIIEFNNTIKGFYSFCYNSYDKYENKIFFEKGYWLDHMFLDEQYIGKGLGTIMFKDLIDEIKNRKETLFYIFVEPFAEGFYKKMGCIYLRESESTIANRNIPVYKYLI